MRVNGNLTLNDNASGEIRHVYIERLDGAGESAAAATLGAAHKGRLIFNSADSVYKYWDGAKFVPLAIGSVANSVQAELDALEAALGAFINTDGTFNAAAFSSLVNFAPGTSLTQLIQNIDQAITNIDVSAQITPIKNELDAVEAAVGLNTDGTFKAPTNTNYINSSTTVLGAAVLLDTALKTQADKEAADKTALETAIAGVNTKATDLQAELDATQAGAGLGTDGHYVAKADANYIAGAASLKAADELLDAAVKANADAVATKQANLGYVPVNKAGDSVNGNLTFGGTATLKNLGAPTEAGDAVRLADLEAAMLGLDIQADVLGKEADFVSGTSVAGRYIYVDGSKFTLGAGVTEVAAGDIVVVGADGVITKKAYDVSVAGPGALVWNRTTSTWNQFAGGTTWSEFGGLSGVTPGVGLAKDGNTINVKLGAGITDKPTGEVGMDLKTEGGLILVDPTSGLESSASDAVLTAKVAGALELSADGIKVKAQGIDAALLGAVAGNGLAGGAGSVVSVKAADSSVLVSADGVKVNMAPLDAKYVDVAGDTMTGSLILKGDATQALEAATKQQVEAGDAAVAATVTAANANITKVVGALNKIHFVYQYTNTGATAAITVTHNLGIKYCNVSVVDSDDEVFIPQSIKFVDANTLQVTLNSDISGRVIVTGFAGLTL